MKTQEIDEIISILPRDRTLFYYFKDRYALMLLDLLLADSISIAELKRTRLSAVLDKPVVKPVIKCAGNGKLDKQQINALWPEDTKLFALTLDRWGSEEYYNQTSRKQQNLVLQLNFSNEHRDKYKRLLKPGPYVSINDHYHPVRDESSEGFTRDTLAWARIDLDFDTGEALIEEIQSDFVRDVNYIYQQVWRYGNGTAYDVYGDYKDIWYYYHYVLEDYRAIWDEAMLAASIDFLVRELGIKHVYYHSWETGTKVKRMTWDKPPRSLYSKLPRRFCFNKTTETPEFLYKDSGFRRLAKKVRHLEWYKLPEVNSAN